MTASGSNLRLFLFFFPLETKIGQIDIKVSPIGIRLGLVPLFVLLVAALEEENRRIYDFSLKRGEAEKLRSLSLCV